MMDNLADAATREVRIDVVVTKTINEVIGNISSGSSNKIPGRAAGGPVVGGRPYIVGEVGPELFIPSVSGSITANSAMGGGKVINLTVNAGMGTDPYEMGRIIVDSVKKYERVSGNVWTPAS